MRKAVIRVPAGEETPDDLWYDGQTVYHTQRSNTVRLRAFYPEHNNPKLFAWMYNQPTTPIDAGDLLPAYVLSRMSSYFQHGPLIASQMLMKHRIRLDFERIARTPEHRLVQHNRQYSLHSPVTDVECNFVGLSYHHIDQHVDDAGFSLPADFQYQPDARFEPDYNIERHYSTLDYLLGRNVIQGYRHNYYPKCRSLYDLVRYVRLQMPNGPYMINAPLIDARGIYKGQIVSETVKIIHRVDDSTYDLADVIISFHNELLKPEYEPDVFIKQAAKDLAYKGLLFRDMYGMLPSMHLYILDYCGTIRKFEVILTDVETPMLEFTTFLEHTPTQYIAFDPSIVKKINIAACSRVRYIQDLEIWGPSGVSTRRKPIDKYEYVVFDIPNDSLPSNAAPVVPPTIENVPLYARSADEIRNYFNIDDPHYPSSTAQDPPHPYRSLPLWNAARDTTSHEYPETEPPDHEALRDIINDHVKHVGSEMYGSVYAQVIKILKELLNIDGFPPGVHSTEGSADMYSIILRYLNVYLNGIIRKAFNLPIPDGRAVPFEQLSQRALMDETALIIYIDNMDKITKDFKERFKVQIA